MLGMVRCEVDIARGADVGFFAVTWRWPGLDAVELPARLTRLMFCAAGFTFLGRLAWWLPFATMLASDLLLNLYYHAHYDTPVFSPELIGNYAAYAVLVWLGRRFGPRASFLSLQRWRCLGYCERRSDHQHPSWLFSIPFTIPSTPNKPSSGWLIAPTKGNSPVSTFPIKMETWSRFLAQHAERRIIYRGFSPGVAELMERLESAEELAAPEAECEEKPEEAKA